MNPPYNLAKLTKIRENKNIQYIINTFRFINLADTLEYEDMMIEICANSIHSAITAQQAGAARIELCENLNEGGTTPSYGTISQVVKLDKIHVFVLIRPRPGDFLYTEEEFKVMKADIQLCKDLKCEGVVLGILNRDGTIDVDRTKELVALARPMEVTFHRAFDRAKDPFKALEDVISTGCERILTSGQGASSIEGIKLLANLVKKAKDRITIMPGAGINSKNIGEVKAKTLAKEFHSSAKSESSSKMDYKKEGLQDESVIVMESNQKEIEKMINELK